MRRRTALLTRAVIGIGALASVLGASTPAVGGAPVDQGVAAVTVTVTPSTDLLDGQTVSVSGAGLPPDTELYVLQCGTDTAPSQPCYPVGDPLVTTDGVGGFEFSGPVDRVLPYGLVGIDCALPGACEILVAPTAEHAVLGTAPLQFDPDVPLPPPPVLTVHPSSDLVDGQTVTVSATGLPPTPVGEAPGGHGIFQCRANPTSFDDCDTSVVVGTATDATGAVSEPFVVRRVISTGSGSVDCGVEPGCVILLDDGTGRIGPAFTISAAIRFRAVAAQEVVVVPAITG